MLRYVMLCYVLFMFCYVRLCCVYVHFVFFYILTLCVTLFGHCFCIYLLGCSYVYKFTIFCLIYLYVGMSGLSLTDCFFFFFHLICSALSVVYVVLCHVLFFLFGGFCYFAIVIVIHWDVYLIICVLLIIR